MTRDPINLAAKLAAFSEPWTPRVVAEMNDDRFKLVKLAGDGCEVEIRYGPPTPAGPPRDA